MTYQDAHPESEQTPHHEKPIRGWVVGSVAALSGLLFGFDASIAAASGSAVNTHFQLQNSPALMGLWVACVPLGAFFGALLGGKISHYLGRKKGLLLNGLLFVVALLLATLSPTFSVFVLARLLMGFAIGNSAVITPMYMAEVAPPESRGRILFLYQLSIVIGILVSFLVGVVVSETIANNDISWRIMVGFGLLPAFLFLYGMARMPDSPRWLLEKGHFKEGLTILKRMMPHHQAENTAKEIRESLNDSPQASWSAIFGKMIFPVILLGFFLQFFQQSTGINADMYFGPVIFQEGGFSERASMWAQVGMGTVNLFATIGSIFLVDRIGRRKLMLIGVSGIVVMLGVQAYLFHAYDQARPISGKETAEQQSELGQRHVLPNTGIAVSHKGKVQSLQKQDELSAPVTDPDSSRKLTYLIFLSILLYIFFFAISAGPLCWLIISEIFPLRFRGIGMSIAVAANWMVDYLVSQLFPVMKDDLGMPGTLSIYGVITLVGLLLAFRYLPETKGVPLEKIEKNLEAGLPLRDIGIPRKKIQNESFQN